TSRARRLRCASTPHPPDRRDATDTSPPFAIPAHLTSELGASAALRRLTRLPGATTPAPATATRPHHSPVLDGFGSRRSRSPHLPSSVRMRALLAAQLQIGQPTRSCRSAGQYSRPK